MDNIGEHSLGYKIGSGWNIISDKPEDSINHQNHLGMIGLIPLQIKHHSNDRTQWGHKKNHPNTIWLVVSTPLKNISQLGLLFPIYGKIKTVPNHQPAYWLLNHFWIFLGYGWFHRINIGINHQSKLGKHRSTNSVQELVTSKRNWWYVVQTSWIDASIGIFHDIFSIYIYIYLSIYITSGADIPLHIWYVQWMGCNGNIRNKSDGIIMLPVSYMFIRNLVELFSPTSKCCSIWFMLIPCCSHHYPLVD